jgi:uncharacterized membrane protein YtjA (UPF0391 family)
MLRIIVVFALLTLMAAGFGFGWFTGARSGVSRVLFWIFAVLLAALLLRAATGRREGL